MSAHETLRQAVERFKATRGVHDGEHYQKTGTAPDGMVHYCAQCDESYVKAEAELDAALSVPIPGRQELREKIAQFLHNWCVCHVDIELCRQGADRILALLPEESACRDAFMDDNYVAWLRFVPASDEEGDLVIEVCDSDSEGAFKVWRLPALASSPAPESGLRITGRDVHREWRDGMLAQGRAVAPERMSWETLSEQDKALDERIAKALAAPGSPEPPRSEPVLHGTSEHPPVHKWRDGSLHVEPEPPGPKYVCRGCGKEMDPAYAEAWEGGGARHSVPADAFHPSGWCGPVVPLTETPKEK